jgi:hypothetical protein
MVQDHDEEPQKKMRMESTASRAVATRRLRTRNQRIDLYSYHLADLAVSTALC